MPRAAAVVLRRALPTARDLSALAQLLHAARAPGGDALGRDLASDATVVLLAERGGDALGLAVVRLVSELGATQPARAWLERIFVREDARRAGIGSALAGAAFAEVEARGVGEVRLLVPAGDPAAVAFAAALGLVDDGSLRLFTSPPRVAPAAGVERVSPGADPALRLELVPGADVVVEAGLAPEPAVTCWSGALAFRTRWARDRRTLAWTVDDCVGSRDEGGDAVRFDAATRRLREVYVTRPRSIAIDAALLDALERLPATPAVITLAAGVGDFVLPGASALLFDLGLRCVAGIRRGVVEDPAALRAVGVSPHLALLFAGHRYAGWRVLDPVAHARPMGWPEVRAAEPPRGVSRDLLAALLYDWMTIDASAYVPPDEARDPDDIAHLVSVRDRARALAELEPEGEGDPTPGVARDVAAHVHWSWGFFRVPGGGG